MWQQFPLFPPQASTFAPREDALFFFLVAVSVAFVVLIFSLVTYFAIRYRRRSPDERPARTRRTGFRTQAKGYRRYHPRRSKSALCRFLHMCHLAICRHTKRWPQ